MALFGPKKKDIFSEKETNTEDTLNEEAPISQANKVQQNTTSSSEVIKTPINPALITNCMKTNGSMSGCGSIIIEGSHEGEIEMEDTVVVSRNGSVDGKIKAKNIKISGDVKGIFECDILEITKGSRVEGKMYAQNSYIDGEVNGEIYSDKAIEVNSNGRLTLQECRSQTIKVLGKLSGKVVASHMLEVIRSGSIEGEIVTKGIKTLDGGSVVGTIVTYDEKLHSAKPKRDESATSTTQATETQPQTKPKAQSKQTQPQRELEEDVAELIDVNKIDREKYAPKKDEE